MGTSRRGSSGEWECAGAAQGAADVWSLPVLLLGRMGPFRRHGEQERRVLDRQDAMRGPRTEGEESPRPERELPRSGGETQLSLEDLDRDRSLGTVRGDDGAGTHHDEHDAEAVVLEQGDRIAIRR